MNLGILISGRGSNMEAILKSIKKDNIPINPAVVISNKTDAKGLKIAQRFKIPTIVIESAGFKGSRKEYDLLIMKCLAKYGVTPKKGLVCLAGFMRILSPEFVSRYKHRILNIHPALLPSFPGLHAQQQALDYGAKFSGCTVHLVDAGVDSGPIVLQSVVKIKENDTPESLSKRILRHEHIIYPKAVDLFARGRVKIKGRKVTIIQESGPPKK